LTTPRAKRWLFAAVLIAAGAAACAAPMPGQRLEVEAAAAPVAALVCPVAPPRRPAPPRPGGAPPAPEPTELPEEAEVQRALEGEPGAPAGASSPVQLPPGAQDAWLPAPTLERPLRMAFWGDSHLAAGFFTEELARLLGPVDTLALPRLLPAGFGHAGVRGLVRRGCVTGPWVRESAHASAAAARQPGPGLVSLVNRSPGAELAWDLRDAKGEPRHRRVQLLYTPAGTPVTLELSVDGAPPRVVELEAGPAAAAALELVSTGQALSVLRLRVREGTLRLQGLQLGEGEPPAQPLQIDLFGYPGATVAGWANAQGQAHAAWFGARRYDLVVLAYGTNEANDPGFRVDEYRTQLRRAVDRLRERFPDARCLLVGPGDRGVRVPRKRSRVDLLRHARVHAQVASVQREVASGAGCASWSAQQAMGGPGSAYQWVRQQPPWMAADLIHFTPAGYRELARRLATDFGWTSR
jgi:lysophospholipase L1-like esterase